MEIEKNLRETRLHDIEPASEGIIGSIRINPKNYCDAFVTNPQGGPDIYINGSRSRGSALEGDIVRVQLNPVAQWKLNHNIIANRWFDWSQHLLPLIESSSVEKTSNDRHTNDDRVQLDHAQKPHSSSNIKGNNLKRHVRTKRDITSETNDTEPKPKCDVKLSKLPSNLPDGISKLGVEHVINLPFSALCIQKTGYVTEVIKKNNHGIAGGFLRPYSSEFALFSPTDARFPRMLISMHECPLDFDSQFRRYKNVLFVAQMTEWIGNKSLAKGYLIKIVGDSNTIQSRIEALLMEHQVHDSEFPPDVYQELEYLNCLPANWFRENSKSRRDLTEQCVFTIDPKTARDLDDAVSIRQIAEQVYELGVHIADVSYFVKELTAVDYYARLRTTSVYLVDRVIPMLPRILCEQMCSLNPGDPKLTFSVIWKINKYGQIIDEWFGRTIIKSCVKLSYEQVQDMIETSGDLSWIKEGVNMPKLYSFDWHHISKSVILLNKIAQNLRAKRFGDGALRIDQVKIKYELDPKTGYPTGLTLEDRKEANFLIEEFMLLANMAVAKRIYSFSTDLAFLRRHPSSSGLILKEVKEFCEAKGFPLDITSAGSLQKSLNSITDPTMRKVVSFLLLKSMKNAEYVCAGALPKNDDGLRHFALNVPLYTHFTSPIRRYADLIVHRLLGLALGYDSISNEDVTSLSQMADECTKRKISSKLISDTSQKLYFNLFVQRAGFCELLACVTRIYDQSFDVILTDYDITGRVYMDKLKAHLDSVKFENYSGVKRLVLKWKESVENKSRRSKKKSKRNEVQAQSRSDLESRKSLLTDMELQVNEAKGNNQVIQVFDVINVIVTTDENDITQLKINLKLPSLSY